MMAGYETSPLRETAGDGPASSSREKKVWDPLVRIFHWSLVVLVIFNLVNDEDGRLHELAGYTVAGLIIFRIFWGFAGPYHARFHTFITGLDKVIAYLKGLIDGRGPHYLGHNPAGGWMVLVLIGWLAMTAGTGTILGLELARDTELVEWLHEAFAESLPVIIVVHVAGVLASSLLHQENLIKAMINGKKRMRN